MGYKPSMVLLPYVCYPSAITLLNASDPHCVAEGDTVTAPIVPPSWEKKGEHHFWSLPCGVYRISPLPRSTPAAPCLAPRGCSVPMRGVGVSFCAIPAPASRARSPSAATMLSAPHHPPQLPIRLRSLRCAHGPAAPITRGVAALSAGSGGGERHKGQRRSLRETPLRALSPNYPRRALRTRAPVLGAGRAPTAVLGPAPAAVCDIWGSTRHRLALCCRCFSGEGQYWLLEPPFSSFTTSFSSTLLSAEVA